MEKAMIKLENYSEGENHQKQEKHVTIYHSQIFHHDMN
jgi:hypothetical protein